MLQMTQFIERLASEEMEAEMLDKTNLGEGAT
jgi:hypothetical protein